jgi:hypothetical protein
MFGDTFSATQAIKLLSQITLGALVLGLLNVAKLTKFHFKKNIDTHPLLMNLDTST